MKSIILSIDGMTCSACSNGLEKYLNKQNGIINTSVNLVMANATIDYNEKILDQEKLEKYIKEAGFSSQGIFREIKLSEDNKTEKSKFIVFSILAATLMYISMGHMINLPIIDCLNPHSNPTCYATALLLITLLFLVYGFDILKNGFKNLVHFIPNMDTLVAIGVISSFLYSLFEMYMLIKGKYDNVMNLYFESSAIVIYFVKLGRYIDGVSKNRTREAIQNLVEITPKQATLEINGEEKIVTLDEIKKGNILISKPGEKIAVDGEIIYGKAHLDESFITGESKPTIKSINEKVIAGGFNYDGFIKYKAEKIGKESTVSEIVRLVVEASNTKAPIAKIADKVSGYFVPIVIGIAILTFIVYIIMNIGISGSLITFVTILVVACPCSLGLATPLAVVVSEGECARNGILIKKSEILENAKKTDTIVFDKTGTLTYGTPKIAEVKNYSNIGNDRLFQLIGSIESNSTHPIGKALASYLKEKEIEKLETQEFENIVGLGIKAKLGGNEFVLGNAKILEKYQIENKYMQDENYLANKGDSVVYVVRDNEIIALVGVNDVVRENMKEIIHRFNEKSIKTVMLTGDNEKTAKKIANEIGITEVIANVLPSDKAKIVNELKKENKYVMMCGDGINDSPALVTANIGVSVKSGTDIAMDSSDVVLIKNDLGSIERLINISKKTVKIIKQNLFWAFFYNLLMIPIAIGILKPIGISINPMIASFAMVLSSITVILNTLRLKRNNLKI